MFTDIQETHYNDCANYMYAQIRKQQIVTIVIIVNYQNNVGALSYVSV